MSVSSVFINRFLLFICANVYFFTLLQKMITDCIPKLPSGAFAGPDVLELGTYWMGQKERVADGVRYMKSPQVLRSRVMTHVNSPEKPKSTPSGVISY